MVNTINVLMCTDVLTLLDHRYQRYLRSAGSLGHNAFKELVEARKVTMWVDMAVSSDNSTHDIDGNSASTTPPTATIATKEYVPIRTSTTPGGVGGHILLSGYKRIPDVPDTHTVVMSHREMLRRETHLPDWKAYPWSNVRYEWDSIQSTATPPHFLSKLLAEHIELHGFETARELYYGFLDNCPYLRTIDLDTLCNIQVVGNGFMAGCLCLQTISLSSLANVTTIGNGFLQNCCKLEAVDFTPLSKVTSIGHMLLDGCSKLNEVNLAPLVVGNGGVWPPWKVGGVGVVSTTTSTQRNLLSSCTRLTSIDLSPLSHITAIGSMFMSDCRSIVVVDLTPLVHLESIGISFLSKCTQLTELRWTTTSTNTTPPSNAASSSRDLLPTTISPTSSPTIKSIGASFLNECTSLDHIDLAPLALINTLRALFMTGSGIESVDLSPLVHLDTIEESCFESCPRLRQVLTTKSSSSSPHKKVVIGKQFCSGCTQLRSIDLGMFSATTEIPDYFLSGCSRLSPINLSPLCNVQKIGEGFLDKCKALEVVDLTPFGEHLTSIGSEFMWSCDKLTSIIVSPNMLITSCEGTAFLQCPLFEERSAWAKEFGRLSQTNVEPTAKRNALSADRAVFILGSVIGLRFAKPSMLDSTWLISTVLLVLLPRMIERPTINLLHVITELCHGVRSRIPPVLLSSPIVSLIASSLLPSPPTIIHSLAFIWAVTIVFWRAPIEYVYAQLLPLTSSWWDDGDDAGSSSGIAAMGRLLVVVMLMSTCVLWPILQPFISYAHSHDASAIRVGRRRQTLVAKILSQYNPHILLSVALSGALISIASLTMVTPMMTIRFGGVGGNHDPTHVMVCFVAIWVLTTTTIRIMSEMLSTVVFTPPLIPLLRTETPQQEMERKELGYRYTSTCHTLVFLTTMIAVSTSEESFQINVRNQNLMATHHHPQPHTTFSSLLWYVGGSAALLVWSMVISFAIPRRHIQYRF